LSDNYTIDSTKATNVKKLNELKYSINSTLE